MTIFIDKFREKTCFPNLCLKIIFLTFENPTFKEGVEHQNSVQKCLAFSICERRHVGITIKFAHQLKTKRRNKVRYILTKETAEKVGVH